MSFLRPATNSTRRKRGAVFSFNELITAPILFAACEELAVRDAVRKAVDFKMSKQDV
jgi:hypothetical protein